MLKRVVGVLAVACICATGCTTDEDRLNEARGKARAAVDDIAAVVIEAWSERDEVALGDLLDDEAIATRIVRVVDRAETDGRIASFSVAANGEAEFLDGEVLEEDVVVDFEVPFVVEWVSDAADTPLELEGSFELQYREGNAAWTVLGLNVDDLWPGIDRARGFSVEYTWPKRGAIKDRRGRVIAGGTASKRVYPFGSLAGSTIGHIATVTAADVEAGLDAEVGDLVGGSGLEAAFQERLAGIPDSTLNVVNRRGATIESVGDVGGTPGENVRVTLDMDIQSAAETGFGSTVGGSVVMDPASGDLLAIVDSSKLDPNNYVGATDVQPFNRALSGGYPPGSSMKVVTAAAALDTGVVTPETSVTGPKEYKGVRNFESGKFGTIPFATAVKYSVNTAFAQVAEDLGAKRLTRYAEAFGFNSEPEMLLTARESSFPFPVDLGDLMWSSVGQAQVLATPLQMASVAATVANDGRRMEPRIDMSEKPHGSRVMKVATADTLAALMQSVVEGGTGVGARISGVTIAGKTGTAEVDVAGERKNHAWFICFSPVEDPRVAIAVVSEYGGIGGEVAAPLARAILQSVLPHLP